MSLFKSGRIFETGNNVQGIIAPCQFFSQCPHFRGMYPENTPPGQGVDYPYMSDPVSFIRPELFRDKRFE